MFALYLVLVAMPRFDDSNIVETNLTREQCENASGAANGIHHEMSLEESPRYIWACGPMPPRVDHHTDEVHSI
jgi:hypothetical protein